MSDLKKVRDPSPASRALSRPPLAPSPSRRDQIKNIRDNSPRAANRQPAVIPEAPANLPSSSTQKIKIKEKSQKKSEPSAPEKPNKPKLPVHYPSMSALFHIPKSSHSFCNRLPGLFLRSALLVFLLASSVIVGGIAGTGGVAWLQSLSCGDPKIVSSSENLDGEFCRVQLAFEDYASYSDFVTRYVVDYNSQQNEEFGGDQEKGCEAGAQYSSAEGCSQSSPCLVRCYSGASCGSSVRSLGTCPLEYSSGFSSSFCSVGPKLALGGGDKESPRLYGVAVSVDPYCDENLEVGPGSILVIRGVFLGAAVLLFVSLASMSFVGWKDANAEREDWERRMQFEKGRMMPIAREMRRRVELAWSGGDLGLGVGGVGSGEAPSPTNSVASGSSLGSQLSMGSRLSFGEGSPRKRTLDVDPKDSSGFKSNAPARETGSIFDLSPRSAWVASQKRKSSRSRKRASSVPGKREEPKPEEGGDGRLYYASMHWRNRVTIFYRRLHEVYTRAAKERNTMARVGIVLLVWMLLFLGVLISVLLAPQFYGSGRVRSLGSLIAGESEGVGFGIADLLIFLDVFGQLMLGILATCLVSWPSLYLKRPENNADSLHELSKGVALIITIRGACLKPEGKLKLESLLKQALKFFPRSSIFVLDVNVSLSPVDESWKVVKDVDSKIQYVYLPLADNLTAATHWLTTAYMPNLYQKKLIPRFMHAMIVDCSQGWIWLPEDLFVPGSLLAQKGEVKAVHFPVAHPTRPALDLRAKKETTLAILQVRLSGTCMATNQHVSLWEMRTLAETWRGRGSLPSSSEHSQLIAGIALSSTILEDPVEPVPAVLGPNAASQPVEKEPRSAWRLLRDGAGWGETLLQLKALLTQRSPLRVWGLKISQFLGPLLALFTVFLRPFLLGSLVFRDPTVGLPVVIVLSLLLTWLQGLLLAFPLRQRPDARKKWSVPLLLLPFIVWAEGVLSICGLLHLCLGVDKGGALPEYALRSLRLDDQEKGKEKARSEVLMEERTLLPPVPLNPDIDWFTVWDVDRRALHRAKGMTSAALGEGMGEGTRGEASPGMAGKEDSWSGVQGVDDVLTPLSSNFDHGV